MLPIFVEFLPYQQQQTLLILGKNKGVNALLSRKTMVGSTNTIY
jgi:hypothetical protein